MKRFLTVILSVLLVFSLVACGKTDPAPSGSGTSDPGTSQQQPSEMPDNSQSSGGEETPNSSNDPSVENNSGDTQSSDSLTDLMPKPETGTITYEEEGTLSYTISITWTEEEATAYAKQAQEAGFNQNVDESGAGGIYSFTAENGNGFEVEITCNFGSGIVRFTK